MTRFAFRLVVQLLACAGALGGCAALRQTESEVVTREPGHRVLGEPMPAAPEARRDLQFAWLSDAAYGNTTAGLIEKQEAKAAAPSKDATAAATPGGPDCPVAQDELRATGWTPWPGFPDADLVARIARYHLRVEVWMRREPAAVAVAFGGTVLNNHNDWLSNLRWFLPKWFLAGHPDEYSQTVQDFAPAFVAEFRDKLASGDTDWAFLKQATVYSTGHSLGGGLAQQFAYALPKDDAVPRVSQVFAFDPSPVTGFYSVDVPTRDMNRDTLFIDRIYERGEILAVVRSLTSVVVQPSASKPTIRGVRFSLFYPANPVAGHSMSQLACKMRLAALTGVS